jgi:nicotinamidase-related amidase
MPLTTLDPKPALVVIDLQKGIVSVPTIPTVHPIADIVQRASNLATAFRNHGLPVVLVNVAGRAPGRTDAPRPDVTPPPDSADLVPELNPQPTDHRVTKTRWGAFHQTSLDAHLRDLGVTQIVLSGVATSIGVESTARAAYDLGYNVVLATDAMTDRNAAAHENSVTRIFPRLGETATTTEILSKLDT